MLFFSHALSWKVSNIKSSLLLLKNRSRYFWWNACLCESHFTQDVSVIYIRLNMKYNNSPPNLRFRTSVIYGNIGRKPTKCEKKLKNWRQGRATLLHLTRKSLGYGLLAASLVLSGGLNFCSCGRVSFVYVQTTLILLEYKKVFQLCLLHSGSKALSCLL